MTSVDGEPLPISALEHYCYCPRQAALIHVDGLWADNEHTVRGSHGHRRADTPGRRSERGRIVQRAVPLWSEALGLTGRADAVEIWPDGRIAPVEYKIGREHGIAAHIQLCAEALCLEEMTGRAVPTGYLWHSATARRKPVSFTEALRSETLDVIARTRRLFDERLLPGAPDDERCSQCQLLAACLPGLTANPGRIGRYLDQEVFGSVS